MKRRTHLWISVCVFVAYMPFMKRHPCVSGDPFPYVHTDTKRFDNKEQDTAREATTAVHYTLKKELDSDIRYILDVVLDFNTFF